MTRCLDFLEKWEDDPNQVKPVFERYKNTLSRCADTTLSFKPRPGVTYSLRGACPGNEREMFVMVDVVDDDPTGRWLSVCFYDDQVSDPDDIGDWVPEGLSGQDARCFNIDEADEALVQYGEARILEAWKAATGSA